MNEHMTGEQLDRLWEDARDGALDDEQRCAFDQAISADPKRAALWAAEARWLGVLRDGGAAVEDRGFSAGVVERWRRERDRPIVGRIGGRVWTAATGTAVAALIALGVWVGSNPGGSGVHNAIDAGQPPIAATQPDPVGALMREVDQTVAQQPARIRQVVADTVKLFDVDQYLSRVGAPVPDPRDYLDPGKNKG
jgi:hypothetical protein